MTMKRDYIVTYISADGERLTKTLSGGNHTDVERQLKRMGCKMLSIEREEDEYPRKARSVKRTIGCMVVVLALLVLALTLYWFRTA